MPQFPRQEIEDMVRRWVAANDRAGELGDWSGLADLYTDDAVYSWNYGPDQEFVARGKQQIREWALGNEMLGLQGWSYPYVRTLIDETKAEVVAFWRQIAPSRGNGDAISEIAGTGGSWFRYGGDQRWSWQRDFFDLGNAAALMMQMLQDNTLSDGMKQRMERGPDQPGWVPRASFDWYATITDREA